MIGWWVHALLIGMNAAAVFQDDTAAKRYEYTQVQMGAPWRIIFYAGDAAAANRAAEAAYARVGELNRLLSDYDPESELSRLSRTAPSAAPVPVSKDLWRVLDRSQELARRSDGAFDVTVGPLVRQWRRARRTKELPSAANLADARESVGYQNLALDAQRQTVRLLKPGMWLDLGGIAMGYAADEALLVLREHGFHRAMIDASGDIVVGDPPPGAKGWRIGIGPVEGEGKPTHYIDMANQALALSGDAFQNVEIGGTRYSHIVDPKTGLGLTDRSSVTVIAADCVTADSLATAVSVMGPERGLALVEKTPGTAAYIVRAINAGTEEFRSRGFDKLAITASEATSDQQQSAGN